MRFLFISKPLFMEPLGIMYLSSAIKSLGNKTDLAITSEDLEKKLSEFKPDFVGYSIMTGDQNFYDEINRRLKIKFKFFWRNFEIPFFCFSNKKYFSNI